ncbi:MAG: hypothetical protein LBK47_02765 [Prevotellaceae bacterium]|nr:hypothetical protein [Prevotellaceae bacterium]
MVSPSSGSSTPLRGACPERSRGSRNDEGEGSSTPLRGACPERSRGSRNDEGKGSSTPLRSGRNDEAAVREKALGGVTAAQRFFLNNNGAVISTECTKERVCAWINLLPIPPCRILRQVQDDNALTRC